MGSLLAGSLPVLLGALVLTGVGMPLPEDVLLLASGALAHQRRDPLALVIACCGLAVLCGDVLLFSIARRWGTRVLDRGPMRHILPPHRRKSIDEFLHRRGNSAILIARALPGLRGATFAMAGIHGMPLRRFIALDALGLTISAPLMVSLGYMFSNHIDLIRADEARFDHWALLIAGIVIVAWRLWLWLRGPTVPRSSTVAPA